MILKDCDLMNLKVLVYDLNKLNMVIIFTNIIIIMKSKVCCILIFKSLHNSIHMFSILMVHTFFPSLSNCQKDLIFFCMMFNTFS
jgi:hypothetical protein